MPFPRRLLNDDEDVVAELHPHWWYFAGPAAALLAALAAAIGLGTAVEHGLVRLGLAAAIVAALAWFGLRYLQWSTTYLVVTTDRLLYREGVLRKHGREVALDRINDIGYDQSLFQRLTGSGALVVDAAGERGEQRFSGVPRPALVQNLLHTEIDRHRGRTGGGAGRELSIPEQIEKLDELRHRGILTQAEFDAKKTQLLDRM